MRTHPVQNNFSSGEIDPRLAMRMDLTQYNNGAEQIDNFLVLPFGGLERRPGLRFVWPTKHANKRSILIPFEFSTEQAYIIEAGDLYFRFFRDGGLITETAKTITGVANSAGKYEITTIAAHGYSTGNSVIIDGVEGTPGANGEWVITNTGANTFTLDGSVFAGAYTTGGESVKIVEVTTPYTENDLDGIQWAQSADILYLVHSSFAPRQLERRSHIDWTLATTAFLDGPYLNTNKTATTLALSGTSGSVTVTASAITGINDDTGFQTTDVGRIIRWKDPAGNWTWLEITARASTTSVTATIKGPNASAGTATVNWRLGSWSVTTGYPSAVGFHDQRIIFGASTLEPQTLWASRIGDFEDMAPSVPGGVVAANDAWIYTIFSTKMNRILWIVPDIFMFVGTSGGEFSVAGQSDGPITPEDPPKIQRHSGFGSATTLPVVVGKEVLFIQRTAERVYASAFSYEVNGFDSEEATLFAQHILDSGAKRATFEQVPNFLVWFLKNDGSLAALTYNKKQEVLGWANVSTQGLFESIATIPHWSDPVDVTWTVVNRTLGDASTVRYIEYFDRSLNTDSALTYSGVPIDILGDLSHIEGLTCQVVGDGAVYPPEIVEAGLIILDGPEASVIEAGLSYTSTLKTVRPEAPLPGGGTTVGLPRQWASVSVRLYQSLGLNIQGYVLPFRSTEDLMDIPPPLFTGDTPISLLGLDTDGQITITQTLPLPCTILGMFGVLSYGD